MTYNTYDMKDIIHTNKLSQLCRHLPLMSQVILSWSPASTFFRGRETKADTPIFIYSEIFTGGLGYMCRAILGPSSERAFNLIKEVRYITLG